MGVEWTGDDTISRDKEKDPFAGVKKKEEKEKVKKSKTRTRLNHANNTSNIRRADLRNGTDSDV